MEATDEGQSTLLLFFKSAYLFLIFSIRLLQQKVGKNKKIDTKIKKNAK